MATRSSYEKKLFTLVKTPPHCLSSLYQSSFDLMSLIVIRYRLQPEAVPGKSMGHGTVFGVVMICSQCAIDFEVLEGCEPIRFYC